MAQWREPRPGARSLDCALKSCVILGSRLSSLVPVFDQRTSGPCMDYGRLVLHMDVARPSGRLLDSVGGEAPGCHQALNV